MRVVVGDKVVLESQDQFLPMENLNYSKEVNMPTNTPLDVVDVYDNSKSKGGGVWVKLLGFDYWHPFPKFKKVN